MKLLTAILHVLSIQTAADVAESAGFFFNPGGFVENLSYMGIGMLVIFVVIGVIILTTALINYLFSE